MPIYMDRHYIEGATHHAIATAHERDLQTQHKYGVRFLTYWFDEARSTAFCLVDAPDKKTIIKAHNEAHGSVPHEIVQVDPRVVEGFLGRISDPPEDALSEEKQMDSAFRVIMFTDLKDSTLMTSRHGDTKALHLLNIHNAIIRNALREHHGREVKHTGDGIMASFTDAAAAVACSGSIQRGFGEYNRAGSSEPLQVRIGLNAGEPIESQGDLFGSTVQLAARLCTYAKPGQTLVSSLVVDHFEEKTAFQDLGMVALKGFSESIRVYENRAED